jgi:hypothetical protein
VGGADVCVGDEGALLVDSGVVVPVAAEPVDDSSVGVGVGWSCVVSGAGAALVAGDCGDGTTVSTGAVVPVPVGTTPVGSGRMLR